jgi:hypothetical protein
MQIRNARTDCQYMIASIGLLGRTARTGLLCRTAKTGLLGHDLRDKAARADFCYNKALILAFILALKKLKKTSF